jgi:hypothetical protein
MNDNEAPNADAKRHVCIQITTLCFENITTFGYGDREKGLDTKKSE